MSVMRLEAVGCDRSAARPHRPDVVVDMFRIWIFWGLHQTRQYAAYLHQVQYNYASDLIDLID
jgi:hypothetical protein